MAQLKMYWKAEEPKKVELPEGYTVVNYKSKEDIPVWVELCKNGLLKDDAGNEQFMYRIKEKKHLRPKRDLFFIDCAGKHVATIAAIYTPWKKQGYVHMVSVDASQRGKGLGNCLNYIAKKHLYELGAEYALLTTDEFRKAAVKSYLTAGFVPVHYDTGMEERWAAVLKEYNIPEVDMVNEDGSFYMTIKAAK